MLKDDDSGSLITMYDPNVRKWKKTRSITTYYDGPEEMESMGNPRDETFQDEGHKHEDEKGVT